ncbi:MAG: hypothetical protein RJB39_293 [Candidatus Parcubacteria bacterium]|jgi:triosephosphate isomerase
MPSSTSHKQKSTVSSSKPFIVANWKADTLEYKQAEKNILETYKLLSGSASKVELVFAPVATQIHALKNIFDGSFKYAKPRRIKLPKIALAAQNISVYEGGSKTGEIPVAAMKDAGVKYAIIGHSECRELGDTNATVITKVQLALANKIGVILCVGERERDSGVQYLRVVEEQLVSVFSAIDKKDHNSITIAYEPVWAINNKDNISLDSNGLHSMVVYIRKLLIQRFGEGSSKEVRIIYGGSVTPENAQDILWNGEVQGLLIGRASWTPQSLAGIITSALINPKKNILKQYGASKKNK